MPALALAALLTFGSGAPSAFPAVAQEPVRGATEYFDWEAPAELIAEVRPMTLEADRELERILAWLKIDAVPRGHIQWVEDREELSRVLGYDAPDWFAAVTLPAQGRIVMVLRATADRGQLLQTFRHELVHFAMSTLGAEAFAALPAWFHEGVAELWAEQLLLSGMDVPLGLRAFTGELSSLSRFRDGFGDEPYYASEGYAIAHAYVARLQRIYGPELMGELMAELRAGRTLEQALVERTGLASVTHEEELRRELGSLNQVLGDLYPQFFLMIALFTVAVFPFVVRSRRRRRAQLEEQWQRQDRVDAEDGEEDDRWLNLS